ncbi:hypothetical protein [Rhizobium sp. NLR9b]|uniref:hypothetical protein n=1 Tax=Rhizobium sp. NLR9b TaxID=2731121 RepID=UPI001C82B11B|nr:hypothetical protein [Rhizobium sp. NLR9b]
MNIIKRTQAKEGLEFCFALGISGIAGKEKPVVLVRKNGLTTLRKALEKIPYETTKGLCQPTDFRFLKSGTGRMNKEGVIVVRLGKGGSAQIAEVRRYMKRYFKDFKKTLPDLDVADPLKEEDLNRFEIAAQENSDELPADNQEIAKENRTEGTEENALPDGLKEVIATSAASIAAHSIRISRQTGLLQTAELGPLTIKISDWLKAMLTATPLEEQENALHNFTCRLLLMLAYDDNRRNLQYVDEAPDGDEVKVDSPGVGDGTARQSIVIGGIDLNDVRKEPVEKEEVVETLFRTTKAAVRERKLPYSLESANSDRIATMVSSQWPNEEGRSASRLEILERLIAVVQRLCNSDQLISLIGLKRSDKLEGNLIATIRSIRYDWQACVDLALVHWEETKTEITEKYDVEAMGGSWKPIDELFQSANDVVSNELSNIVELGAEANADVIERSRAVVEATLQSLDGNKFVRLLDNPPPVFSPITVGETLRRGLRTIDSELNSVKASLAAAAA